jgi:toxin ParE1/3/4
VKPARLRPAAERDLVEIAHWYADQGGAALADRFFEEARAALSTVERTPGIGSLRLGEIAGVPGLRSWALQNFPVRWFYLERPEFLDVLRLLGERQDIAAILGPGPH